MPPTESQNRPPDSPKIAADDAMSHQIGDKVRRSYLRGDMVEERRRLMEDWAQLCNVPLQPAKVFTLTKQVDLAKKVR
jgi:hypothetical protein